MAFILWKSGPSRILSHNSFLFFNKKNNINVSMIQYISKAKNLILKEFFFLLHLKK